MEINREDIYKKYMEWVNKIADECDWKTSFEPKEIVYKICQLIEDAKK